VKLPMMFLAVLVSVMACSAEAPDATTRVGPALPTLAQAGTAEIDAYLREATADGRVPKAVAMVANAEGVVYQGAFGKRDVAANIDVKMDAIFNLASMTKPITSVATMMLYEAGAFDLDDPVSMYLPELGGRKVVTSIDEAARTYATEPAKSEITIRQLLANASGLAYNFANPTMQALVDITGAELMDLPLVSHPGTKWNYSGGTAVLATLVAKISGMPYDEFLRTRIFEPLGMVDTFYAVPADKRNRVVTIHSLVDGQLVETPTPETVRSTVRGDGGLNGTAADYIRFLRMLLNDGELDGTRLLSAASVEAMRSNQIGTINVETQVSTNPARSADFPVGAGRDKFGLGFQITASNTHNPDLRAPGSYTWAGIYNTHFWGDPERGIVAVILMQQLPFYGPDAMRVYQGFEERVNRNLNH